mgnify:CR=1 FL=1
MYTIYQKRIKNTERYEKRTDKNRVARNPCHAREEEKYICKNIGRQGKFFFQKGFHCSFSPFFSR